MHFPYIHIFWNCSYIHKNDKIMFHYKKQAKFLYTQSTYTITITMISIF